MADIGIPYSEGQAVLAKYYSDEQGPYPYQVRHALLNMMNALQGAAESVAAVKALHVDAGVGLGYLPDGTHGDIEHCCGTCGTFGEYGEPWPCATYLALDQIEKAIEGKA